MKDAAACENVIEAVKAAGYTKVILRPDGRVAVTTPTTIWPIEHTKAAIDSLNG